MKTKKQTETTSTSKFRVYRYWPVEYRSVVTVEASSPEEAARLALEDEEYDDAEACDGSDGPTEIGRIVEETEDGEEIEHDLPGDPRVVVEFSRAEAAALLSGIDVALDANGGDCPDSVREALVSAVERLNAAFDFGL